MSQLRLIPEVPAQDPEWMLAFMCHMVERRPKLQRDMLMHHSAHAFSAMFLLDPIEAASLWDETMTARIPSWAAFR